MICPLFFRYSLLSKLIILFHSLKIDFKKKKKNSAPPKCRRYFFLPPKFCWFLFAAILFASFASFFVDLLSLAQPIYSIIDYFIVLIFYSHPSQFHIWIRSMGQTIFTLRMRCIGQTSWITLLYLVDYPLARLFYPYITTNMIRYTCFFKCCTPLNR